MVRLTSNRGPLLALAAGLALCACGSDDGPRREQPTPREGAQASNQSNPAAPAQSANDEPAREPGEAEPPYRVILGARVPSAIAGLTAGLDALPEGAARALRQFDVSDAASLLKFIPGDAYFSWTVNMRVINGPALRPAWEDALSQVQGITPSDVTYLREAWQGFAGATERCAFALGSVWWVLGCEGDYSPTGWLPRGVTEENYAQVRAAPIASLSDGLYLISGRYFIFATGESIQAHPEGVAGWLLDRANSEPTGSGSVLGHPLDPGADVHVLERGGVRIHASQLIRGDERPTLVELSGTSRPTEDGRTEVPLVMSVVMSSPEVAEQAATAIRAAYDARSPRSGDEDNALAQRLLSSVQTTGPVTSVELPLDVVLSYFFRRQGQRILNQIRNIQGHDHEAALEQIRDGISRGFAEGNPVPEIPWTPSSIPCLGRPNSDPEAFSDPVWDMIGFAPAETRFAFQVRVLPNFRAGRDRIMLESRTRLECHGAMTGDATLNGWIEDGQLEWEPVIMEHTGDADAPEPGDGDAPEDQPAPLPPKPDEE